MLRCLVFAAVVLAAAPAGADSYAVRDASGAVLAAVSIESAELDQVLTAPSPRGELAAAVVIHGRDGGATLYLVRAGEARELLQTFADESLTQPVWSADGARFALGRSFAPVWISGAAVPRLQSRGALLVGDAAGALASASGPGDVVRALGWLSWRTVVITRALPGDLPEERPYAFDLATGELRPLLDARTHHAYGLAFADGHVYFSRTDTEVVTAPAPQERVEIVEADGFGAERVIATEQGFLATDLHRDGGTLSFILDGSFTGRRIDLRTGVESTVALELPSAPGLFSPHPGGDLAMPYIHQVYDTPDAFNGHWACGPTSTLMGICHFARLKPWPITVSSPSSHTSDYGAYDADKYTAYGTTFDRVQNDASGRPAQGAYGWCTDGGGAWAYRMQDYAKRHDLSSDFDGSPSFAKVKAAIDAGKAVALSTQLTSAGHIIAIKGYTTDGKLVANDPYGDKNKGYMNYKGEGAVYTWAQVSSKWLVTIYGTVTPTNNPPKGSLDSVTCDAAGGWSQDPDEPTKAIDVHLYFGGAAGSGAPGVAVHADLDRADLCKPLGSCNHAFSMLSPLSLFDGVAHAIHAYGIDSKGGANAELTGSPKSLKCVATPPAGVKRHVASPAVLTAWKFSLFNDEIAASDAVLDAMTADQDIPAAPSMIRAADAPEVWLVDDGFRRHVPSPEVAANWRLDLATVLVKTAAEVSAYPEATPLRSRPVLVKGSGAAVYLVDDALPEPDAGTPAPDARAAGPDAAALAADASQPPGAPDGSIPSHDGSIAAGADATSGPGATDVNSGCGCAASGSGSLPLFAAVLAFWAVVARRRRVAG